MGNTDQMFLFNLLAVAKSQAGKGLATKMMQYSINLAKEAEFKVLTSETTGVASTRIFAKLGFEAVKKLNYDDYTNSKGEKIFLGVNPPHVGCTVWLKQI